ncbi:MAG: PilZ domain-containing protein, partial [Syntrophales bacterium LBB04]|nr:PilZ domain-containing protein [Syntrophales bacterium LBB04]
MEDKPSKDCSEAWLGSKGENRRANRRRTMAQVTFLEKAVKNEPAVVTNVSKDGLYIHTKRLLDVGERLNFTLRLPTNSHKPMKGVGVVVRTDQSGMGLRFQDLTSKDRSRIREYSGFVDLDDTIVELQNRMQGLISGNLLPVSEWPMIENRLKKASEKNLPVLIVLSTKKSQTISARLRYNQKLLELVELDRPLPQNTNVMYRLVADGPLQAVFEG